ncbi:hypothetical protein AWB67_03649 [Caballeronia terrestris]|jgi:hypothetical protein|uniref:Uncharacterized protein n=1 Tax=Caballeronia terrestris TaxID=1226301 RepID=A0A158JBI2_9BURK|nr:hypothetical protein [Caballeronia terrestris]SAL66208.1 hypothetical protein AWB67_03649 [Caballeronia terrestris]
MRDSAEVGYKGFSLTPLTVEEDGSYTAMLIVCDPDGVQRASGALGNFPSALEAMRFALRYGMAEIDGCRVPVVM